MLFLCSDLTEMLHVDFIEPDFILVAPAGNVDQPRCVRQPSLPLQDVLSKLGTRRRAVKAAPWLGLGTCTRATVYQGKSLSRTQARENLESGGLSVVVHVNLWWITNAHVRTSAYWAMAPVLVIGHSPRPC